MEITVAMAEGKKKKVLIPIERHLIT